jgi:phosphate-selective porin OprO/OprP
MENLAMNRSDKKIFAAKSVVIAVATLCASLSAPVFAATDDVKSLMDLLLKKGVITQSDYDQHIKAAEEAAENREFKEKRIDKDVAKANEFLLKNKDAGQVMKNGIGIQSADGANTIQLMGRLHMDYRSYSSGYATGAAEKDNLTDALDVRRARLGVRGQIEKDFKYEIQGTYGMADNGMSESSTIVDIAFVDYAANPAAMFRAGKFKMPFSLEQLTSSNNIDFMERSFANQNEGEYVPGKETGVMLHGSPVAGASYGLAFSRGRANKNAQYDGADFIGRGTTNIAKLMGRDDIVTHLGIGYSSGKVKSATSYASNRDESRAFSGFFGGTEAVSAGATRTRSDVEYAVAYGPFKAQGEFFQIGYSKTGTDGDSRAVKMNYNELLWNITGESHNYNNANGTFGWIKPNNKFTSNGGLGAWQIGVRLSDFDGSEFTPVTGTASRTDKATSLTYGLNWYVNDNVRFMLNYVETKFDDSVGMGLAAAGNLTKLDKIKAIMLRSQISF